MEETVLQAANLLCLTQGHTHVQSRNKVFRFNGPLSDDGLVCRPDALIDGISDAGLSEHDE